ncbi:MAG: hypothetical protein ACRDTT_11830, partial [Pseudonocardiaceae bacterium]
NAARMFVDWSLTARAQELAATAKAFQIPTQPDAAVPAQAVKLADVRIVAGYSASLSEHLREGDFTNRFGAEVRNGVTAPVDG